MIDFSKISNVWFIGIGGIGMSALARYFAAGGFMTGGYDRTDSAITDDLLAEGVRVIHDDDPDKMPDAFRKIEKTLVIYTPAIPASNRILAWCRGKGYSIHKRSEVLGLISGNTSTIAIAGTHGKTSVSTLTAHLLKQSHVDCSAFLGGISKNYRTNMLIGEGRITVMEADEYDRSFHRLRPEMAVITSLDADHLDVYGSYGNMVEAYEVFLNNIKGEGPIILNEGIRDKLKIPGRLKTYTYGFRSSNDFYASDISVYEGAYRFNVHTPHETVNELSLLTPGKMNIENSIAAIALAMLAGVKEKEIRKALVYYNGVSRRFDVRISTDHLVYIDDYAHHPAEIDYCIDSVREFYGERKITGVFQPHLFSRTRDNASGFAKALDKLDKAIILPVYPAREEAIEGVSSEMIIERMESENKILVEKEDLTDLLKTMDIDILLTIGAGDIDRLTGPVESLLKERL